MGFLVVEDFLEVVHHLVADLVLPPEPDQFPPLGLDRLVAQADLADAGLRQFLDEALVDVDGWTTE